MAGPAPEPEDRGGAAEAAGYPAPAREVRAELRGPLAGRGAGAAPVTGRTLLLET